MPFLGETAALGTALLWSAASILFAIASRRAGAFALNLVRITLAAFLLAGFLTWTRGPGWMAEAGGRSLAVLAVSGVIGLTLGDLAYFAALARLGPRVGAVFMTLGPPFTALLAFLLLGESMGLLALLGMFVTLSGVARVVLERPAKAIPRGHRVQGAVFGALAALGQGGGLVLSKIGMEGGLDPLAASAVRMIAAGAGIWAVGLAGRGMGSVARLFRDRAARWATLGATFVGPIFGVWLSLVAVKNAPAGIAATLMTTFPVLILPLVVVIHHETVSRRAALGAVVAVGGVALLFLR
jgi:drug/metabolite transporter (DMT)-like permease